jgi:hypothetical protein
MKPTQEQTERLRVWLDARLSALFAGRPFPPIPASLESDLHGGVDFSTIFQEYGLTQDGLGLLPNFYEIHMKKEKSVTHRERYGTSDNRGVTLIPFDLRNL